MKLGCGAAVKDVDLFRGRSQFLVYHMMFGPDYAAACPSCSAIANGFNGIVIHLENHDVAFTAVSRAPLAKLQALHRRGLFIERQAAVQRPTAAPRCCARTVV